MVLVNIVNVFVFLTTITLIIIILTVYRILNPEYKEPEYNFRPFPSITPENIASYKTSMADKVICDEELQECDPEVGCVLCNEDYECTTVGKNEKVVYKGNDVKPGNWCLPAGKKELGCGAYTGRAIWADINGEQQWKCVCLYPDLFAGKGCTTQIACRDNREDRFSYIDQTDNKLQGIVDGKNHYWDPSDPDFDPQGKTPYDYYGGDPIYKCSCNAGGGKKYVSIPGDPYSCHLDPCDINHIGYFDKDTNKCMCTKDVDGNYAKSSTTNKCLLQTYFCDKYDIQNKKCECGDPNSLIFPILCNSKNTPRKDEETTNHYNKAFPKDCPDNPGGSYCDNVCKNCKNGVGYKGKNGECVCWCKNNWKGENCDIRCESEGKNGTKRDGGDSCCGYFWGYRDNCYENIGGVGVWNLTKKGCGDGKAEFSNHPGECKSDGNRGKTIP